MFLLENPIGLNRNRQFLKKIFDVQFSFIGRFFMCIQILYLTVITTFSAKKIGLFSQQPDGKNAKLFSI